MMVMMILQLHSPHHHPSSCVVGVLLCPSRLFPPLRSSNAGLCLLLGSCCSMRVCKGDQRELEES